MVFLRSDLFLDMYEQCPDDPRPYLEITYTCTPPRPPVALTACTKESTTIDCGERIINIETAVWGRSVLSECTGSLTLADLEDECELDVLSYMSDLCDNKTSCTFKPKQGIFGGKDMRPCKKEKYLNLTYTCEGSETVTLCQDKADKFICSAATEPLNITSAIYGQSGSDNTEECPGSSNTSQCSQDVTAFLQEECAEKNLEVCIAYAAILTFYKGICPHHFLPDKLWTPLEITYTCTPRPPVALIACHGNATTIDCGDLHINIETAVWGRSVLNECTGSLTSADLEDECELDVLSFMSDLCDDMTSCTFKPKQRIFGGKAIRPCKQEKYLNLSYTCEVPTTQAPTTQEPVATTPEAITPPSCSTTVNVCDGTSQNLICPEGEEVYLCSATYGRSDSTTCPGANIDTTMNCLTDAEETKTRLSIISCPNEKCSPFASSLYYGDLGCAADQAYLTVSWTCIPSTIPPVEPQ